MSGSKKIKVTAPQAEITGLKPKRKYYFQVRALSSTGGNLTAFSAKKAYWTLKKSGYPVLAPVVTAAVPDGSNYLRLSFSARKGAGKYLVRYSTSKNFSPTDRLTVSTNSLLVPGLKGATDYYISIRALKSSGGAISYYSPAVRVRTGADYRSTVIAGSASSEPLRVASYNVKCYGCEKKGELSWAKRRQAVADHILGQRPDVIGIQEVSQANMSGSTLSQFDDLARLLGDPYRLANAYRYNCATSTSSSGCKKVNRGASQSVRIIYNAQELALVDTGSLKLAHVSTKDNDRYLAWAKLRQISTGKEFYFGTTHLQPNPGGRTTQYDSKYTPLRDTQAEQIRKELARVNTSKLPVVLTGDFNSRWNSPAAKAGQYRNGPYSILTAAGYADPLNSGSVADRAKGPTPGIELVNAEYYTANGYERIAKRNPAGSVGTNVDYIFLSSKVRTTAWETVVEVDQRSGEFTGIIPSDHNLIRADVALP